MDQNTSFENNGFKTRSYYYSKDYDDHAHEWTKANEDEGIDVS